MNKSTILVLTLVALVLGALSIAIVQQANGSPFNVNPVQENTPTAPSPTVPEFGSLLMLVLLAIATAAAILWRKQKIGRLPLVDA